MCGTPNASKNAYANGSALPFRRKIPGINNLQLLLHRTIYEEKVENTNMENIPETPETQYYPDWRGKSSYIILSVMVERVSTPITHLVDSIIEQGYDKTSACSIVDEAQKSPFNLDIDDHTGLVTARGNWMLN